MSATDGDGHAIEYSFVSGTQGVFVINADTGVINMNDTLDREEQSEVRLEIRATDDGNSMSSSSSCVLLKPMLQCVYGIPEYVFRISPCDCSVSNVVVNQYHILYDICTQWPGRHFSQT